MGAQTSTRADCVSFVRPDTTHSTNVAEEPAFGYTSKMPNIRFDVAVIGAGPAGAFAAYELAKRGISVALLEKETLPRYKACGGVVAPHVEKLLDFSIDPAIERRISKMLVTVRFKSPFLTHSPMPFAYMVMRDTFDNFMVEKAKAEGARVYDNMPLQSLKSESDTFTLTSGDNQFHARYLVAADGANSGTRRLLGAPRFQRLSVAIEREVTCRPRHFGAMGGHDSPGFRRYGKRICVGFPKAP